ncbi:MAG: hypothetical protein ACSW75_02705, partial [Lachnospiraceae bacterium]
FAIGRNSSIAFRAVSRISSYVMAEPPFILMKVYHEKMHSRSEKLPSSLSKPAKVIFIFVKMTKKRFSFAVFSYIIYIKQAHSADEDGGRYERIP